MFYELMTERWGREKKRAGQGAGRGEYWWIPQGILFERTASARAGAVYPVFRELSNTQI